MPSLSAPRTHGFCRVLRYVSSAVGETDVPEALPEFISQRRRWLNGSFFAATYAIAHIPQMMRSGHSFTRKLWLLVQAIYNIINLIASWFALVGYSFGLYSRILSYPCRVTFTSSSLF
jgi:cellulose synthase/poly-beta-1,6-N-acetylglucosamine synthase-like glycosyltransferase